uniref:T-lymphocyte activation antigen CD80 n=1 Tax=Jaculus jaculus TaxID=51337 RepID=UPI001E1B36D2|nr:T-lymphocyte activation antigen CD80 [Jaculus jaculus]
MGSPLRQKAPPPKRGLLGPLGLFFTLAGLLHVSSGTHQVTKAVNEIATLSCAYNISLDELARIRVYWQKGNKMVLSIMSGSVKKWDTYENRTLIDLRDNLSLVILALHLSDMGTYTCIIQKSDEKGIYKREHMISVTLSIKANFPVPSIMELGHPFPNIARIMCSTSGGFPKPHLSWRGSEDLSVVSTTVSQDPETWLYTVSSKLDFNVTYNQSFVCVVQYGEHTVSSVYDWIKRKQREPWRLYYV